MLPELSKLKQNLADSMKFCLTSQWITYEDREQKTDNFDSKD